MARAFFLCLFLALSGCATAFDAAPVRGTDLTGEWRLNTALSDDAEQALQERLEEERRRYAHARREEERMRPYGAPEGIDVDAPPPGRRALRPWQERRIENFRKMLAITDFLKIRQEGAQMQIDSAVDSRRLTAGSDSQVSMPEGNLADSEVGWDGDRFVIERRVRRGPRVTERYRILDTGQLEYEMSWGGDTELAGIKLKRVFDKMEGAAPSPAAPMK